MVVVFCIVEVERERRDAMKRLCLQSLTLVDINPSSRDGCVDWFVKKGGLCHVSLPFILFLDGDCILRGRLTLDMQCMYPVRDL